MPIIDLHTHSKCSDGTDRPSEVVVESVKRKVTLFSLTDHDTTEGTAEAVEKCAKYKLPCVTGVEISAREHDQLHFLGYGMDVGNAEFQAFLANNRNLRINRVKKTIAQLAAEGVPLSEEEVFDKIKNTASRAHVADAMKAKGIAQTRQDAFKRFLIPGKAGYVPPSGMEAAQVISAIKKAGGKAVIAHPGLSRSKWDFKAWKDAGLDGLEVFYPSHNQVTIQELLGIAREYGFFVTGGSDNHGTKSGRTNKPGMEIPPVYYEQLLKALGL